MNEYYYDNNWHKTDKKIEQFNIRNKHTFYDTTYLWVRPVNTLLPKEGKIIAGPYLLKPYLIPFNDEIQLNVLVESVHSSMHICIYYFDIS